MSDISKKGLMRLPQVLGLVPISKSKWWKGCKDGIYPQPIKIGPRTTALRTSDIEALLDKLAAEKEAK